MSALEQELAGLKLGDHVCLLYEDGAEALAADVLFITYGLARGEQCLYVSGERAVDLSWELTIDQVAGTLAARGVDVRRELERGALLLWPTFDLHFPPGVFDPAALITFQRALAHNAVAAGFVGLRLVVDMTWVLEYLSDYGNLVNFEAIWNDFAAGNPIVGLCQYTRRRFTPEVLRDVLRTHPLALLGGHLCPNLYYESPSLVVDLGAAAQRVDWMMAQLVRTHLAEERLQEAEARYRSIFESTNDGLLLLDPDGIIIEANPGLCRMHGYSRNELLGQPPTVLIHPDHHAKVAVLLRADAANHELSVSVVDLRKDGTSFHAEIHGTGFTYLGRPHLLWVIRDVTAQVNARQLLEQQVAERTRELTTLLAVARNVASTLELEPLLSLVLEQLRDVVDYRGAAIRVVREEELVALAYQGPAAREQVLGPLDPGWGLTALLWEVIRTREPVIIDDLQGNTPLARAVQEGAAARLTVIFGEVRAWLGVPLLLNDRVLGLLSLGHPTPGYYTPRHGALLMAIASHLAVAMENVRLYQQVQDQAITEERARIAREVHDSVAQVLFYVNTQAEASLTLVRIGQTERAAEQLEQLAQAARDAYADVREDILALRTAGTAPGLLESLSTYLPLWQEQSGVGAQLLVTPAGEPVPVLPSAAEIQLVRIVQEALTNVRKHAHARQVQIRIGVSDGQVTVVVEDDGQGFDPRRPGRGPAPHFGLALMRERAAAVGGRLEIDSGLGRGTRVIVRVPAEAAPGNPERKN